MNGFSLDIKAIRERARQHMMEGAITQGYRADRSDVVRVLNEVLATELVCYLRYKRHYYMTVGINSESVKQEFQRHALEEQQHIDLVAERIVQLNGAPDYNPEVLSKRSHSEYTDSEDLGTMMKDNLAAERIAIETYSEIIRWLGNDDPTTREVIEEILKKEEEHADDLKSLLTNLP